MRLLWCEVCVIAAMVLFCVQPLRAQDANSTGQTIAAIKVEGNVSVKQTEVLAKVRSRQGRIFDTQTAAEDTKRIAEIPGVEYCYYHTKLLDSQVELTFVVVEKNIIRSIEFEGNKAYRDKKLQEKLGFKVGDYLDPVLAQTYVTTIVEFYRKNGFPYTEVTLDATKVPLGKLIYTVREGPRVKIVSVKFAGNKNIKSDSLKKIVKTKTKSFVVFQKYYQEDRLTEDTSKLRKAYQKRGYLDAKIEARQQFNADKTKVKITFAIEEGIAYSVEAVSFAGNVEYDNKKLYDLLTLRENQVYNEQKAELDTRELVKNYKENGFIDAKVERTLKFVTDKTVAIEYSIKEGNQFRIGQIIVTGNENTKDKVVRRILDEYDFQPGNFYNANIARGDGKGELEKILQRSLLTERDGATITPAEGKTEDQKDARVNIIEGKTGMVMLGAGISSDAGVIGQISFEQRNFDIEDKPESLKDLISGKKFRGGGQTLRISAQPGTEISQFSVSFTEPYLNDKPVSLDLVGSKWERFRESYDETRTKGYVGLEKRYKDKWRRSIGFRAENVKVTDLEDDAPVEIRDVEGSNFLAGVRVGLGRTLVDDIYNPAKGHSFEIGYEQVAGDHTFGVPSITFRKYHTLYEDIAERKTVLAGKFLAATTVSDAPPFEKFYAGGTGTYGIRGFEYRGVSTRGLQTNVANPEKEDPIGSDWIVIANAETTLPLVGDTISALFFVDSGAIDTGGVRVGAGAGIQILIPQWFGPVPMRFELAAPLMKDEDDETQTFSFSVGALF